MVGRLAAITLVLIGLLAAAGLAAYQWLGPNTPAPASEPTTAAVEPTTPTVEAGPQPTGPAESEATELLSTVKDFFTDQLTTPEPTTLHFSAKIPADWEVEFVPEIEAINFYDPTADGGEPLNQSQIFVRYFEASDFLTLSTVTIHGRTETTVNDRPTVIYEIEKRPGVANFPSQPDWRNERHIVTDIRSTDDSPTIFYVFAKRPDLDPAIYQAFLESVVFNPDLAPPATDSASPPSDERAAGDLRLPVAGFFDHSTKKRFGDFIAPETSPVQPERFTGFHTGVDVETSPEQQEHDVPVQAIAPGTVLFASRVSGYGGVLIIEHTVNGETVSALYGHLRPTAFAVAVSDGVTAGQSIGVLGTGFTDETDFERKHLHFSLKPGHDTDLRGYVGSEAELAGWHDPIAWFAEHGIAP